MHQRFRVAFYCPDRHLTYDGYTPDRKGIGGGVTARLRLAAALARRGHSVEVVCNCERAATTGGVEFRPLDTVQRIQADVLVLHTSGGRLDLSPVQSLNLECARRIVFVDGVVEPRGLSQIGMDSLYASSNFISGIAQRQWGIRPDRVFVTHHGVVARYFRRRWWQKDDRRPWRIAYATHPSKGLDAAVGVLRMLRLVDERFELHVLGGNRLWGGPEEENGKEPGLTYHGLVGQRELAKELMRCGFALYLQTRPEPFGISVGAHPEIIDSGATGFLLEGDPAEESLRRRAAEIIAAVHGDPPFAKRMRRRA